MSYLKPIARRKCAVCEKWATHTLFNRYNSEIADYCRAHGQIRKERADSHERALAPKAEE